MSPYPGAFEQHFCPGGGAFASSFSKNANSRGSVRGGGGMGGGMGTAGIDCCIIVFPWSMRHSYQFHGVTLPLQTARISVQFSSIRERPKQVEKEQTIPS